MRTSALSTRLPSDLAEALDVVCRELGLRKNFLIEAALREKLEDLLDSEDLREAVAEASAFHPWEEVKREARSGKRR